MSDDGISIVRDYRKDGKGYYIEHGFSGFRWSYTEAGETDRGPWWQLESHALRDAADDWDDNGEGYRVSATLRAVATRLENQR